MKLFKKLRKGFTLIELVVVIAVIAVLAAVSVVSYIAITNNAKKSNDQQLIDQVNLSLKAHEISKKPTTMHEALLAVEEDGFIPANMKISPEFKDYKFAYNLNDNQFVILNKSKEVVYPKDARKNAAKHELWLFADKKAEFENVEGEKEYSHYLRGQGAKDAITVEAGLDVGYNRAIPQVTYATSGAQGVVIRTHGGKLKINASAGHVEHYNISSKVEVNAISSTTYVEHGSVGQLVIGASAESVVLSQTAFVIDLQNNNPDVTYSNAGYVANVSAGGSSSIQPTAGAIKVYDYEQLQAVALSSSDNNFSFAGKTIQLQNDIDMEGKEWVPFGLSSSKAFSGTIDGNGKAIKKLGFKESIQSRVDEFASLTDNGTPFGLIAFAEKNVTIKELTVDCAILANEGVGVGGLIGVYNNLVAGNDTTEYTLEIKNCKVTGSIVAKNKVGGFIGTGFITQGSPWAKANVGTDNRRGKTATIFDGCTNSAYLKVLRTSGAKVGGFASGLVCYRNTTTTDIGGATIVIKNACKNYGAIEHAGTAWVGSFASYISGSGSYTINHTEFENLNGVEDILDQSKAAGEGAQTPSCMYVSSTLVW